MPISTGTHILYTVRHGDSLNAIANAFGTNVPAIVEANALYPPHNVPDRIFPGQTLLIRLPGMSQQSNLLYQVRPGDTFYRIASDFAVDVDMLAALNRLQQPGMLFVGQQLYVPGFLYEVESGDTLSIIARRYGTSLSQLFRWNYNRPGLSTDVITPGFLLLVPLPFSTNIVVFDPLPASLVAQGQRMTGVARAFEAVIQYRVVEDTGRVVTPEQAVMTNAGAPAYGTFAIPLRFEQTPIYPTGKVQVYTRSANDGSVRDLVEFPISFSY